MSVEAVERDKKTNRGFCAIIGLCFTTFLLKVGLIIQTIVTLIAKNKIIASYTILFATSSALNIYLGIENSNLQKDLSECKNSLYNLSSTMTTTVENSTWDVSDYTTNHTEIPTTINVTSTIENEETKSTNLASVDENGEGIEPTRPTKDIAAPTLPNR